MGYDPLHILGDSSVSYQYCGGNTQLTNLTSLASADYAFISQTLSMQSSYLITQASTLGEKFAAAKYEAPIDFSDLANCYHGFATKAQTKVCDDQQNCEKKETDCPDTD